MTKAANYPFSKEFGIGQGINKSKVTKKTVTSSENIWRIEVSFPEFSSRFAKDADVVLKDFGEMFEVGTCRCEISGRLTGTEKSDCLFGARWFEAAESNIDQGASRHLAFSFLIKINNEQYIMDLVASLWRSSYLARYAHEKLEVAGAEVGSFKSGCTAIWTSLQWNAKTTRRSVMGFSYDLGQSSWTLR
ncbi:hypothetical protein BDP67DRAFT_490374 [Colletotrichum lupini]|nr:hypothetical protein BDP67DRAFT_490374 [Colletotrichum lupini]